MAGVVLNNLASDDQDDYGRLEESDPRLRDPNYRHGCHGFIYADDDSTLWNECNRRAVIMVVR